MAGAVLGIYGNSSTEAMYPVLATDSDGAPLNGANNYTLRFAPGELPPVNAFWSVTMYKLPESLLVANPINRYLINSPMLPNLVKDPDGGLTIYIQNSSPGPEKEPNWLPSPPGPFTALHAPLLTEARGARRHVAATEDRQGELRAWSPRVDPLKTATP